MKDQQLLTSLPQSELKRIHDKMEIDALKDVILAVSFMKKYEQMTLEQLRERYKATNNNTKKHLIERVGIWKKSKS